MQLEGPRTRIRLGTFHGHDPEMSVRSSSLQLATMEGDMEFYVPKVYVVPELKVLIKEKL